MMNLAPLNMEARPIADQAAQVYLKHTEPFFIGLLAYGDALKGRFLPGCSELLFKLYLEQTAFSEHGHLPFELCEYIQRELSVIHSVPYRYIHCSVVSNVDPAPGPVGGSYHLMAGRVPVEEATNKALHEAAEEALKGLVPVPVSMANGLLEPGGGGLEYQLRELCSRTWSMLFHLLTLLQKDGIRVYSLSKSEALEMLPADSEFKQSIHSFMTALRACPPGRATPDKALNAITQGVRFLRSVRSWRDGEKAS